MNLRRQGRRIEDKRIKKHVKGFYSILGEMDDVAQRIVKDERVLEVNDNTIEGIAQEYTKRKIGSMEKMLLLSKLKRDTEDGSDIPSREE